MNGLLSSNDNAGKGLNGNLNQHSAQKADQFTHQSDPYGSMWYNLNQGSYSKSGYTAEKNILIELVTLNNSIQSVGALELLKHFQVN